LEAVRFHLHPSAPVRIAAACATRGSLVRRHHPSLH
jgi:hypothetical protein